MTRTLTRTRDLRPKPPQATTNPHTFLVADIWEVNGESWKPSARWISTHSAPAEKPTARKPRSCSPRSGHRPSPGKHLTTQGLGRGVDRESTACNHRGRKTEPNPQHQQARLPTAARSQPAQATSPSGALTTAPPPPPRLPLTSDAGLAGKLPAVRPEVQDDLGPGSHSRGFSDFKHPRPEMWERESQLRTVRLTGPPPYVQSLFLGLSQAGPKPTRRDKPERHHF